MAQPMTLIATPDPDDNQMPACPDFCDGTCVEWPEEKGDAHHTSGFTTLTVPSDRRGETLDLDVSVSRTDDDFQVGTLDVNLLGFNHGGATLTAAHARQLAAMLLNAADLADPLPSGVMVTPAGRVRIGDEIDTPDGWQTVNGLLIFPDADQAALFTPEKDDIDSDGYQHSMLDPVRVRRPLNGSCAIPFVKPTISLGGAR